MLSAQETRAAEALLAAAWGPGVEVRSAEQIWDRSNILRLSLADGRSVVLKRGRDADSRAPLRGFPAEVAALSFLNGMETPVAPRLLGADADILIMEDLGPASSLAHSLLAPDPVRARADLVAYGRALGAMHGWSFGRGRLFASLAGSGLAGVLPRLGALAEAMHAHLSERWPETVVPDYPALARPGVPLARLPEEWESAS